MTTVYPKAYLGEKVVPIEEATLSVTSSAVLYGLSVYTVFPLIPISNTIAAFRLEDHYTRLINSARIIGIDTFEKEWIYDRFKEAVQDIIEANTISQRVFVRATVHVNEPVAGTRSRGLATTVSMFVYEATPIIPQDGARLKTSTWRRVSDTAIPSRAKVNGAYVNSVLGKQDALDSGYDDCIFLDAHGHVCELSAANIFLVRDGTLITPGNTNDILEGINRKTVLELAHELGISTYERTVDLTELYIADEIFACGTSSFIAPVTEIDARKIGMTAPGPITKRIKEAHNAIFENENTPYKKFLTFFTL